MTPAATKALPVLLVIWGLINMAFPLWHALQTVSSDGSVLAADSAHIGVGLTAMIAGLALVALIRRIDEVERAARHTRPFTEGSSTRS